MPVWLARVLEHLLDFTNTLNTSIAASWMVLAVIVLRFLSKKAPKWSHVALWGLVALRLLLPFSIESAFSLIPSAETVPHEMLSYEGVLLHDPAYLDIVSNPGFPGGISIPAGKTVGSLQWDLLDMTFLWLAGMAVMLLYTALSYWRLHRKVNTAVRYRDNIFQSEYVTSPFVLGIIKPRIYLPYQMAAQDLAHVIAHEQAHIHRRDHWWKPLGFLLLTIHWFNPVMWLAYVLLCRDIELACDERVIKEMGSEQRADYTQALVSCSVNHRHIAACPLAFGEVGVKERVKSVMNYKKPTAWAVTLALVACVVVAVCFLTDPVERNESHDQYSLRIGVTGVKEIQISRPGSSGGIVNADGSLFRKGEVVWLDESDLRGVSITAIDQNGKAVYSISVPTNASDDEISKLVKADSWIIAPNKTSQSSTDPQRQAISETLTLLFRNDEKLVAAIKESTGYLGIGVGDTASNERPADAMLRERYADLFTPSGLDAFLTRDDAYRFPLYIHHAAVTPRLDALTVEQAEESNAYRFTLTVFCDDQAFPIVGSVKFDGVLLEEFYLNANLWEAFLIEQAENERMAWEYFQSVPNADGADSAALTTDVLRQIYPDAKIHFSHFYGEGDAAVVLYEQQGQYLLDTVEKHRLEPQRVWNLAHPPLNITQSDNGVLYFVGIESRPWLHEPPATDFPEMLSLTWERGSGFHNRYEQYWASADQSHTYGEGNGDGIYAVLHEVSMDENGISFSFGPGTEPEQKESFYAAIARAPRTMVSFDGQQGKLVLHDVRAALDGKHNLTDIQVYQEGNDTIVYFKWQKSFRHYTLNTTYKNGVDPVMTLQLA